MSDRSRVVEPVQSVFQRKGRHAPSCRVGTFNVRSLRSNFKKQTIIADFESYRLDVLGLTETWIEGQGVDTLDNGHVLYRSGGQSSRAGVGILINNKFKNNVRSYQFHSDRLISVKLVLNPRADSRCVTIVCCYAPTLQRSTSNPQEADRFYALLHEVVQSSKRRDELWLLGDFNAKVGSSVPGSNSPVGCFSKHVSTNSNGERLVELCEDNNLVLTNTIFKHRMEHRSTWFSDGLRYPDGKPVRNMIDFVIMKRSSLTQVTDSRSYGGFTTRSDHHPVIADISVALSRQRSAPRSQELCFKRYNPPSTQSIRSYNNKIEQQLPNLPQLSSVEDLDTCWQGFVSICHQAAEESFGLVTPGAKPKKSSNPLVASLSKKQKELHIQIQREGDASRKRSLKTDRNAILHQIKSILKEEGDQFWQSKADAVDAKLPDPRSYFNAVRNLRQLRGQSSAPPPVRLADDNGNIVSDTSWNLKAFNDYFKSVFYRDGLPNTVSSVDFNSSLHEDPFTVQEVESAISRQKSGGAVGIDGISAVMLKAAKDLFAPWLTSFFNTMQSLHHCPDDMLAGLIVPLHKSGKPLGLPKSYRPVMLLSVIRKVLTSILTNRYTEDVQEYVTESQAGFRPGRSTADGVFYTRSMCERATIGDWSYSAALLDFSGAFDTVIRQEALHRMSAAGAPTSTAAALISNTTARVKLNGHLSDAFPTNIGVVQGDPMSPVMFITYAEGTMRKIRDLPLPDPQLPSQFTQYADDTTVHDKSESAAENVVSKCEPVFANDNLKLNVNKTQYVTASKLNDDWKNTKLLGSFLGSAEDVSSRMSAANRAFSSISWKRHTLKSRLYMFRCLILPILLYNCGLWTLTKALSNKLNQWHRKKLRFILGIAHPHHISSHSLYKKTSEEPISRICGKRRLLWFGHVVREGSDSASFQALDLAMNVQDVRRPRGRPPLRWIDTVKKDLELVDLSLAAAAHIAHDRKAWLAIVNRCVDLMQFE